MNPTSPRSTATGPVSSAPKELAFELMAASRRLGRTSRRAVRRGWPAPPLPTAQVEVLQIVAERPGVGVTEAATALCLATNTVSTLAKSLIEAGLLSREPGEGDRRSVRLVVTPAAQRRMARWRDRRAEVVASALVGLPEADLAVLGAAIPVLDRLADALDDQ